MVRKVLLGDGTKNFPWFIRGYPEQFTNRKTLLNFCEASGVDRLDLVHSSVYFLRTPQGWLETSDLPQTREFRGIPDGGRLVKL